MKVSLSEDGLELRFACDGFPYEAFNKAGKMDLWAIAKQFELAGSAAFVNNFMGIINHTTVRAFIKLQILEISPDFYKLASVVSPWRLTHRLSYLGTTSFGYEMAILCEGSEKELVRLSLLAVRIDLNTRRPIPLPDDGVASVRKKVKKAFVAPPRVEFPATIPASAEVFTFTTTALPSDTDTNQHINQAASFKYCVNCASLAANQGSILQKFNLEMDYYNMTKFAVEYVGEIRTGDVVDVLCWQDSNDFSILHFRVKNGEKIACRCLGQWQTHPDGSLVEFTKKVISDSAMAAIQNDTGRVLAHL